MTEILSNGGNGTVIDTFLNNIDVAIIVLLVSFLIGKLSNILLRKLFLEIQLDKTVKLVTKVNLKLSKVISNSVSTIIYIIGIGWSLALLGLLTYIMNFIGIIILIAVFGSFILSVRDFLPNLVSGFWIRKKINEGNYITLDRFEGEIVDIDVLSITLKKDDDTIVEPYSSFTGEELVIED